MKTQPGLHGVTYEISHSEYKMLETKLVNVAMLVERQLLPDLVREELGNIAKILGIKLDGSEEERTEGGG